jgi:hypothetical protein
MLRTVSGIGTDRAKSVFAKGKDRPPGKRNKLSLAQINLPIRFRRQGFEPLPSIRTFEIVDYFSKTACGSVGVLCQLGHICEELLRLADEKTHVC